MDTHLEKELNYGEKLLWTAKPEPFETMDKTNKHCIINKIITTCVIVALLLAAYIVYALVSGSGIKLVLIIILVACGVFGSLNTVIDASKLRGHTTYAATDKRLIILGDSVKDLSFDAIGKAAFKKDEDGHSSLLCGKTIDSKPSTWRAATVAGARVNDDTKLCESFAMYAVPDADKVKAILAEYISF